jgi:hypothetical protein
LWVFANARLSLMFSFYLKRCKKGLEAMPSEIELIKIISPQTTPFHVVSSSTKNCRGFETGNHKCSALRLCHKILFSRWLERNQDQQSQLKPLLSKYKRRIIC